MKRAWLRLIGDIHGNARTYCSLLDNAEYSLQIGDLGFSYPYLDQVPGNHRHIMGNHDNYDLFDKYRHNLGHFGVWNVGGFGPIFFVRGGFSIDWKSRCPVDVYSSNGTIVARKSIWENEELSYAQCTEAMQLYREIKPKMLVSHEGPYSVVPLVTNPEVTRSMGYGSEPIPTRTNQLLQCMIEAHPPKIHVFGHYHNALDKQIGETRFVCIEPEDYLDLDKNFLSELK